MVGREPAGQGGGVAPGETFNAQQNGLRKWLGINGHPASSGFVRPFNSKNLFNRKSMIDNNGRGRTQMGPKTDSQAWGSPSLLKILNLSNRIRLNPSVQFFMALAYCHHPVQSDMEKTVINSD